MKWIGKPKSKACNTELLGRLLDEQLDAPEVRWVQSHLDTCAACQRRLTEMSGDASWWMDASRWLELDAGGLDGLDTCDQIDADLETEVENGAQSGLAIQRLMETGLLKQSRRDGVMGTIGRYAVTHVLGAGGTGLVLRAEDSDLNRIVAIKVLSPNLSVSGAARKRFAREGQAVAAVAQENVVAIHHVEAGGPLPYLVMQYVDGVSLQELVMDSGPLSSKAALRITAQVAAALSAAHAQGLVHRDVKPANILVGSGAQRVWITDFGLARAVDDASLTRTGFIAGTPHYMSPEQARGESISGSSDLFGLGSVLYFMLTGRPPFRAERTLAILNRICTEPHRPVREVDPDVPTEVAAMVDKLLEKRPENRFESAASVQTHCHELMARNALPDPAPRSATYDEAAEELAANRWGRTSRITTFLVVAVVCLGGAALAHQFDLFRRSTRASATNLQSLVSTDGTTAYGADLNGAAAYTSGTHSGVLPRAASQPPIYAPYRGGQTPGQPRHSAPSLSSASAARPSAPANTFAPSFAAPPPSFPRSPANQPQDIEHLTESSPPAFASSPAELIEWAAEYAALASKVQRLSEQWQTEFEPPQGAATSYPAARSAGAEDDFGESLSKFSDQLRQVSGLPEASGVPFQ